MVIQTNIEALNAWRYMNNNKMSQHSKKLSSGLKINSASDGAADLAISEHMRSQIKGLEMAGKNIEDGISLIQTAEGGLSEIESICQRVRELTIQALNDTNTDAERSKIQNEIDECIAEVDAIANNSEFNTKKLLNGDLSGGGKKNFYTNEVYVKGTPTRYASYRAVVDFSAMTEGATLVINDGTNEHKFEFDTDGTLNDPAAIIVDISGDSSSQGIANAFATACNATGAFKATIYSSASDKKSMRIQSRNLAVTDFKVSYDLGDNHDGMYFQIGANSRQLMNIKIESMLSTDLEIDELSVKDKAAANKTLEKIDGALEIVAVERANLGSYQNRLDFSFDYTEVAGENLQAAKSRIVDADMAKEVGEFYKEQSLGQAAQLMMVQANQRMDSVLKLLG